MINPYQPPDELFPDDDIHDPDRYEGADYDEAREYWPTCPECGMRLTITCPFCKTSDNLFPLGDTEHWDDDLGGSLVEYQHRLDRKFASRSVLFGDGDTSMPFDDFDHTPDDESERDYDRESLPFVVVCPTCNEAFIPSFPGGCRHWHYVWDRSKPLDAQTEFDSPSPRQWAIVIAGFVILLIFIVLFILLNYRL